MTQTTLREYLRTTEDAISSGRIDEAMANCQNILTYFPEALEAQRLLGEVYLAQGHLEEAQQTFEWILTNDPENVIVYCDRALISERASDIDTALDCYQQAYELSRGNANIRQEFNQLSARAGQQEFMFSRAGLARLYMRGDLLTQAIQEWEAVLAISPERLDARLGLMETYWREGMYEKAEQIATQLLEELPTCLKALLYLAHIASISNIQRARELLQRAAALDPELVMAQEVFADLAASQPNDPFLELIKKEPILLEDGAPINLQSINAPVSAPQPVQPAQSATSTYGNWEALENWDKQVQSSATLNSPIPDPTSLVSQQAEVPEPASSLEPEMPTWQSQLASQEEQPWYQNEPFAADADSLQSWSKLESASTTQAAWSSDAQEEELPVPPAWLDTLTRSEPQPTEPPAFQKQAEPQPPEPEVLPTPAPEIKAQKPAEPEPAAPEEEAMPFFFPPEEESESDMGWPEWLKSLGAETLEPEQAPPSEPLPDIDATPIRPAVETRSWEASQQVEQEQLSPEADPWAALPTLSANNDAWATSNDQPDWMQQISPSGDASTTGATPDWIQQFSGSSTNHESQNSTPDWMQQFPEIESQYAQEPATPASAQASSVTDEQEQRYVASLEDLEKSLQTQGFVPLAPGSLAAIASTQPSSTTQPQPEAEPSLSSALAQLGGLSQSAPTTNEPWWASNTLASQAAEQPMPAIPHTPSEPLNPFAALGARTADEVAQPPLSPLPATPTPTPPAQPAAPDAGMGTPLMPAYRSDALLDSDLETTMKRPAITLKPMQPGAVHNDRTYTGGKSHERKPLEHADDGNLSNHERLVKGYQYQLSGAYDEAMQEYRLIIRNAPELLDDVISNLRALLKFTPRFSLGYRVLGDAYMRKGEYLQAMESYNKALTMAKKSRG